MSKEMEEPRVTCIFDPSDEPSNRIDSLRLALMISFLLHLVTLIYLVVR